MIKNKLSSEDIKNICNLYSQGKTTKEIGEKYNVTKSTVRYHLHKNRIEVKNNLHLSEEDIHKICSLYEKGMSVLAISKKFKTSCQWIYCLFKKNNIGIRQEILSDIQIKKVVSLYSLGNNATHIGKIFNKSTATILNCLKRHNIKSRGNRAYTGNFDYFKEIDSQNKAYFLGYIFADGCVREYTAGKNRTVLDYYFILKLHFQDYYILEFLRREINYTGEIIKELNTNCYKLKINSKKFCLNLIDKGCVPRKSLILEKPLNINKKLYSHFIRGFIDGDGCVYVHPRKPSSSKVQITSTKQICLFIQRVLQEIGIKSYIYASNGHIKRGKNTFCLVVQSYKNLIYLFNYIYKDANYFLYRKKDKAKQIIKYANKNKDRFKILF